MSGQHAPLAPSFAPIWGNCSGAIPASAAVPSFDSPASREGTATHWVAAECLNRWKQPGSGAPKCIEWHGQAAPNGVVIDDRMVEGAQMLVDDVLRVCQEHGGLRSLLVEHRVHMPQIHADNWGTLDAGLWVPDRNRVYLWDYKHGHESVSAKHNLQLIDYLAGMINEMEIPGHASVVFRIVQPYSYNDGGPIKEWRCTVDELRPWFNQLALKAGEAMSGNAKMSAGAWCCRCPAVGRCDTAKRCGYTIARYVNEPYAIDTMTPADKAVERRILLDAQRLLKGRIEAIEEDLKHDIQAGATGTGLALEASQSNLDWTVPVPQAVAFCKQFDVDISKEAAKTPTQAIADAPKEVRAVFKKALGNISGRSVTGSKLVEADDSLVSLAFSKKEA